MCDMKYLQTAASAASDFCTQAYAAELIGVSVRQVGRLIKDGKLNAESPRVGSRESRRHKKILRYDQVCQYAAAVHLLRGDSDA